MLEQHTMPEEYSKTRSFIYCNDCEIKCWSKFHFLYHKCTSCNGYNTKVLQTQDIGDGVDPLVEQEEKLQKEKPEKLVASVSEPSVSSNSMQE